MKNFERFSSPETGFSVLLNEHIPTELKELYGQKVFTDIEIPKLDQQKMVESVTEKFETFIQTAPIIDILDHYNIERSQITTTETKETGIPLLEIPITKHFWEKRLPDGYGYKGGAARTLLRLNLGIGAKKPRDIDVIRLDQIQPSTEKDASVSEEFMPEDFSHGHGVEIIYEPDEYFYTRDFTINEVYATEKTILCTEQCILDTIRGIIRITDYEYGLINEEGEEIASRYSDFQAPPKLLVKLLRLYTEGIVENSKTSISGTEKSEFSQITNMFWVALQIEKAYERGLPYAQKFVEELVSQDILPGSIHTASDAAIYVGTKLSRPFYFRHAPVTQLDIEKKIKEQTPYKTWEKYEEYDSVLPKQRGHRRSAGIK